ncbi:hypothetical protein ACA910_005043 [Epithemia clementina (nom. ined.)]
MPFQQQQTQNDNGANLIRALRRACRRPLFEDIYLLHQNKRLKQHDEAVKIRSTTTTSQADQKPSRKPPPPDSESGVDEIASSDNGIYDKLSWSELLQKAATMATCFTEEQHREALHLSSILFLGFLCPYSTGNENRLLQNVNRDFSQNNNSNNHQINNKFDPEHCVLEMSLIDRLDQISTMPYQKEYGVEIDSLTDPRVELAYDDFLQKGLLPFLNSRPLDRQQVDILHLIAMVINPHTEWDDSSSSSKSKNSNNNPLPPHPCSAKARQLMRHAVAPKFQIHYGHRVEWVRLLATQQAIVLPSLSIDEVVAPTAPLLFGSLPHLQCSLIQFASNSALTTDDSNTAYAALFALATQTKNLPLVVQIWQIILHRILDNPIVYHCTHGHLPYRPVTQFWPLNYNDETETVKGSSSYCTHGICGQLLAASIVRCGPDLAAMALSSLPDMIEWQVDAWTKDEEDEPDKKPPASPCRLMALLFAARHALLVARRTSLDEDALGTLVDNALVLLRHMESHIRTEAVRLLEVAFAYAVNPAPYVVSIMETIKKGRSKPEFLQGMDSLVKVAVQASPEFAEQLWEFLLDPSASSTSVDHAKQESRIVACLCANQPFVILNGYDALERRMEAVESGSEIAMDMLAAALVGRQTQYFVQPDDAESKAKKAVHYMRDKSSSRWDSYRMACYAMTLGDYCFSVHGFRSLDAENSFNEEHFLWVSALENVAKAESLLASKASKAIPDACCHLHTSLSYIHHLHHSKAMEGCDDKVSFAFQSRYLLLRLDQLDLITVIRQLTRETRLTGAVPIKNTRHFQHLMGAVRSLEHLAERFLQLNQQHGIQFQSGMSTTCLFAQHDFCKFLVKATRATFDEIFSATPSSSSPSTSKFGKKDGDSNYSRGRKKSLLLMNKLIYELDRHVLTAMNDSMEPLVRAAAMLELLDALLMAPSPFPKDFFSPRAFPLAELHLAAVPSEVMEHGGRLGQNVIETCPLISPTLQVHGKIPTELLKKARCPIGVALLWCRFQYSSPLDDEAPTATLPGEEETATSRETIASRLPQLGVPYQNFCMLADGRFHGTVELPHFVYEGWFVLETKLGCRDARGNEWELPVKPASRQISIHCSRSM